MKLEGPRLLAPVSRLARLVLRILAVCPIASAGVTRLAQECKMAYIHGDVAKEVGYKS